jgi:hypothetical protein
VGVYIDRGEAISKANMGKGEATKMLVEQLAKMKQAAPRMYEKLLDLPDISAKAKANLKRLFAYGGEGERPDYELLLDILGEGGVRALLDRVEKLGYGGLVSIEPTGGGSFA